VRVPVRRAAAFSLLAAALLLSGCDTSKRQTAEVLSASSPGKKILRIAASDEVYQKIVRIAETFAARKGIQVEISQTQGLNIPGLVEKGLTDVGATANRGRDGKALSYVPYAYDGIAFFSAPDALVRSLSLEQIRRIFSGNITNWKEVGGADAEIRIIERPAYSSVRRALAESLFAGRYPKCRSSIVLETSENAYQALKRISSYLAYAPMSRFMVEQFPAVPLTVDGMPPVIANVPSVRYPSKLEYGILFPANPSETVTEFANYLVSVDGMHMLASLGLVPVSGKLSLSACHCRATEGVFNPARTPLLGGTLTIGVVPELGAIEQEKRYAGIGRLVAEELGVTAQLKHLESYGRVVEEFEGGRIDAAFVGSLVYGELHERFGAVPLVRPEKGKVSHYRGVLIARAGSGIQRVSDLRGKVFVYVAGTTAGELFAHSLVGSAALDPRNRYFAAVKAVASHADAVELVVSGKADAAAVKDLVLDRMIATTPAIKGKVRIVGSSPPFPENSLVVSPLLDAKLRARMRDILLECGKTETGKAALAALGADRFVPTAHEDYATVYEMARLVGYKLEKK
jgi:phosphate/phosphite/phosphonate ABC transporter binding protein